MLGSLTLPSNPLRRPSLPKLRVHEAVGGEAGVRLRALHGLVENTFRQTHYEPVDLSVKVFNVLNQHVSRLIVQVHFATRSGK